MAPGIEMNNNYWNDESRSPRALLLAPIDIEGFEMQVLSQIDLTKYKTKMLIIEWNGRAHDKTNFTEYCAKHKMKLIEQNPENLIFTK